MEKKTLSLEALYEFIRQESEHYGVLNDDESIVNIDEDLNSEFVSHMKEAVGLFLNEQLLKESEEVYDDFEDPEFLLLDDDDDDEDDD